MSPELLRLDRYRLETVLRRGAGISTWAGVDTTTMEPVVVKELRIENLREWKEHDLFRREIDVLASLSHPGIPRLLAQGEDDDTGAVVLVMERVAGVSLELGLERGQPLAVPNVARIVRGVLEVLVYLHQLAPPVVHRDIKPSNVVLGPERVYLVDFGGVTRFLPWEQGGSTLVGTCGYMAPEQLHGEASPASDLYAVGATAAALLAGCDAARLPRDGLRVDLTRIPAARPPLASVLERLLDPDPARRFASAEEALLALRDAEATPEPSPPDATPWRWRHLARGSLLSVGGSSLLAGAVLEGLRHLVLGGGMELLQQVAIGLASFGLALTMGGLALRSRAGFRSRLLRLARMQGGRLHLADAIDRLRLSPPRARDLLEELVRTGLASPDPALEGLYWVG